MSGFCVNEMRYLPEREVMDRYFWGDASSTMSQEEKKAMLEKRGLEYPDCCGLKSGNKITLFSPSKVELTIVSHESGGGYRSTSTYIDCCGQKIRLFNKDNLISEPISEDIYEQEIIENRKTWKSLGAD